MASRMSTPTNAFPCSSRDKTMPTNTICTRPRSSDNAVSRSMYKAAHWLPISPPGGWLRSDDPGVANLGHHARHHVVEIVAVKRPAAGIVGVKGDGDAAHRWHQDGIAHGAYERRAVEGDYLEGVAMEVHRMRHHRAVHHLNRHALTGGDYQRGYLRPIFA